MADKPKGFKATPNTAGLSTKDAAQTKADKPKINGLPKPKFKWPIRPIVAIGAILAVSAWLQQESPPRPHYKPQGDTAPKRAGDEYTQKLKQRNAELASQGLPPIGVDVRTNMGRAYNTRADQYFSPEGAQARASGFSAIFNSIYKERLPATVKNNINHVMTHRDPEHAIYETIKVDHSQSFHIAAAAMDKSGTVNSFVCVEEGGKVNDFYHAQAIPNNQGQLNVTISDKITHEGYMKGANLMQQFGGKDCAEGLRQVHIALNSSGETYALNLDRSKRQANRTENERGLKSPYTN